MDFEYINHKEFGVTAKKVNEILKKTDWDEFDKWYKKHKLPQGLQCVELHYFPTMHAFVDFLVEKKKIKADEILKLKIALRIDSMIS